MCVYVYIAIIVVINIIIIIDIHYRAPASLNVKHCASGIWTSARRT